MKHHYKEPLSVGEIFHDLVYGIVRVVSCRKVSSGAYAGCYLVRLSKDQEVSS